jgi:hypothetical protein
MPVILATQEAEVRRIQFSRLYLEDSQHKIGLEEWIKRYSTC